MSPDGSTKSLPPEERLLRLLRGKRAEPAPAQPPPPQPAAASCTRGRSPGRPRTRRFCSRYSPIVLVSISPQPSPRSTCGALTGAAPSPVRYFSGWRICSVVVGSFSKMPRLPRSNRGATVFTKQ